MKRSRLVALGLLALAAALVVLAWPRAGQRVEPAGPDEAAPAVTRPDQALQAPSSSRARTIEPSDALAPPADEGPALERTSQQAAHQPALETILLSGSVTVTDDAGVEHSDEDGQLIVFARFGGHRAGFRVVVTGGSWSCLVPEGSHISIDELELGGRLAVCDLGPRDAIPFPENGFLALQARWPPSTSIVVKAADTGRELDGIEVVAGLEFPAGIHPHPGPYGPDLVVTTDAASPVALPPRRLSGYDPAIHARTPGYAWGRIAVDPERGGERLLVLSPGGDLRVHLVGPTPPAGTVLSIRPADKDQPIAELDIDPAERVLTVESLPVGPIEVFAQLGAWFEDPVRLGAQSSEVIHERLSELTLSLAAAPEVQRAPISGTLVVPLSWKLERRALRFSFQGPATGNEDRIMLGDEQLAPVPERPGHFAWSVPAAQVGTWQVEFSGPLVRTTFELGPGGKSGIVLELPPPASVKLRVVDRSTGEPADVEEISWSPQTTGNSRSYSVVYRDTATGAFDFQATLGKIVVSASDRGGHYERASRQFVVKEGLNEVELEVERRKGVAIVLVDGDTVLPWEDRWHAYPKRVDPGRSGGWGSSGLPGGGKLFTVPTPGLYRIDFPDIEGYEPIPPLEVRFEEGSLQTFEIPLVRTP